MNLKEQTYICTLARCGTIRKAADELFLTAPALSMFLSNLEKNLGVQLFSRTGKILQPTPIGEKYIRCASQMLLLKEEFDRELAKEIGLQKQTVRVGIQSRRAISAIPWLLSRLERELPNIHVVFRDGQHVDLVKLVEQHQVDYLFYTMDAPIPGTDYVLLEEEPILAAVPENHPCTRQEKHSPELELPYLDVRLLQGETLILPPKAQSLRLRVEQMMREAGLYAASVIEIGHFDIIIKMVSQGMGIGFNRIRYLEDMLRPEGVRYYFLGEKPVCSPLVLLYPKEKKNPLYHNALVQVFRDYLRQT